MDDGKIDNSDQSYVGSAVGGFITGAICPLGGTEAIGLKGIAAQFTKNGLAGMAGNAAGQQISTGKIDFKEALLTGAISGVLTTAAGKIPEIWGAADSTNIDHILAKHGMSFDEFNSLKLKDISSLTDTEKATLKSIRDSIPMPDAKTEMQKVIPSSNIEKYISGTYTKIGGYVTRASDVTQLSTYDDIYNSLRLDYPGSSFNPSADNSVGIIRYTTDEASKIKIPYGAEMGGNEVAEQPFTGNGFTKATNGQIIPEFKCDSYLDVADGARLIDVKKDGSETLKAIYSENRGKFIPLKQSGGRI